MQTNSFNFIKFLRQTKEQYEYFSTIVLQDYQICYFLSIAFPSLENMYNNFFSELNPKYSNLLKQSSTSIEKDAIENAHISEANRKFANELKYIFDSSIDVLQPTDPIIRFLRSIQNITWSDSVFHNLDYYVQKTQEQYDASLKEIQRLESIKHKRTFESAFHSTNNSYAPRSTFKDNTSYQDPYAPILPGKVKIARQTSDAPDKEHAINTALNEPTIYSNIMSYLEPKSGGKKRRKTKSRKTKHRKHHIKTKHRKH